MLTHTRDKENVPMLHHLVIETDREVDGAELCELATYEGAA